MIPDPVRYQFVIDKITSVTVSCLESSKGQCRNFIVYLLGNAKNLLHLKAVLYAMDGEFIEKIFASRLKTLALSDDSSRMELEKMTGNFQFNHSLESLKLDFRHEIDVHFWKIMLKYSKNLRSIEATEVNDELLEQIYSYQGRLKSLHLVINDVKITNFGSTEDDDGESFDYSRHQQKFASRFYNELSCWNSGTILGRSGNKHSIRELKELNHLYVHVLKTNPDKNFSFSQIILPELRSIHIRIAGFCNRFNYNLRSLTVALENSQFLEELELVDVEFDRLNFTGIDEFLPLASKLKYFRRLFVIENKSLRFLERDAKTVSELFEVCPTLSLLRQQDVLFFRDMVTKNIDREYLW